MQVKGKNTLVVGFARSGLAAANFLLRRGAQVTITDLRTEQQLAGALSQLIKPARLSLQGHRRQDFLNQDFIVLSPGVPSTLPELTEAAQDGIPIYSEVELAYRFLEGTVIGVTGSNGKTTTTLIIGELLRAHGRPCVVAGNIGSPLISSLENARPSASGPVTFVVELSSFQLETIDKFRCDTALFLNLSPDHLDRYPQLSDYMQAKERIFMNQTRRSWAVLNADNPHTLAMSRRRNSRVLLFSCRQELEEGAFVRDNAIHISHDGQSQRLMSLHRIGLRGSHNLENILAATTAGFLAGLEAKVMAETIGSFRAVEHRLEPVMDLNGIAFYNDSKATNIDSAQRAIEAFEEPLILLMGGKDKGADFGTLRAVVEERVKLLILIGAATETIAAALGNQVPTLRAQDMEQAVGLAFEKAAAGDVVLLAPGCASFDMFEDFEHRGRVFKDAVQRLGHPEGGEKKGGRTIEC